MIRKLIGQSMVDAHLIDQKQLSDLLEYQNRLREKLPLGRISLDMGLVLEDDFAPFIASYFTVPYINLKEHPDAQKEALETIPEIIAKRFNVLPLTKEDDTLTIAVSDPLDLTTIENIEAVAHCRVKTVISAPSQIKNRITLSYGIL